MTRTYPLIRRAGIRLLAAALLATTIAACGSSSSTPPASSSTPPAATPTTSTPSTTAPAKPAPSTTSRKPSPTTSGSGASSVSKSAQALGGSAGASSPTEGQATTAAPSSGSGSAGALQQANGAGASSTTTTGSAPAYTTPTPVATTPTVVPKPTTPKPTKHATKPAPEKVRYVIKVVAPDLPTGAFMPSRHPILSVRRFITKGGNLGCTLTTSQVRCAIVSRVWTPPTQPSACTGSWGDTLLLSHTGMAAFACGGASKPPSQAPVVPDGWDDKIGDFTCQVRTFGVDCFQASDGRGLILSRTGYSTY